MKQVDSAGGFSVVPVYPCPLRHAGMVRTRAEKEIAAAEKRIPKGSG